jgi:hypothetical protein
LLLTPRIHLVIELAEVTKNISLRHLLAMI